MRHNEWKTIPWLKQVRKTLLLPIVNLLRFQSHQGQRQPTNQSLHLSDEEALAKPHQAADERLHGLLSHRAEEDNRDPARHTQRGGLQGAGQALEGAEQRGQGAVRPGGRAAAPPAHAGVPRLQVPAEEEARQGRAVPGPARDTHRHSDQIGETSGRRKVKAPPDAEAHH